MKCKKVAKKIGFLKIYKYVYSLEIGELPFSAFKSLKNYN